MAIGATIYTLDINLADVDRGVYEEISLKVAQHPSETLEYMLTRVLAYCLEHEPGIDFGAGGVSSTDEPAVLVRDLTGALTKWIEVGAPDAQRLHHGMKLAGRAAVYTHRDPVKVLAAFSGKTIHRRKDITVTSFDSGFIDAVAAELSRRSTLTVSVTEGQLYLEVNGASLHSELHRHELS